MHRQLCKGLPLLERGAWIELARNDSNVHISWTSNIMIAIQDVVNLPRYCGAGEKQYNPLHFRSKEFQPFRFRVLPSTGWRFDCVLGKAARGF